MFRLISFPLAFPAGIMLSIMSFILISFIFWVWMLIDCIKSNLKDTDKLIWLLIILIFNILGALIYLILVKLNKDYGGFKIEMKTNKNIKRLYRSKKNRMIGGVCGGIGEYFNVDPTLIRLVWILFLFAGGAGLLAYIIAWIIIPLEK